MTTTYNNIIIESEALAKVRVSLVPTPQLPLGPRSYMAIVANEPEMLVSTRVTLESARAIAEAWSAVVADIAWREYGTDDGLSAGLDARDELRLASVGQ